MTYPPRERTDTMTPTDEKPITAEALMKIVEELRCSNYNHAPVQVKLLAAIRQYGGAQYARGVNDAWPAGRGSGEPIAMLHDDGHWTHPPGRDPLDRFSGKVRMEVYAAPQPPHEPLTEGQIDSAIAEHVDPIATYGRLVAFARAIERAHNIRSASSDAVHRSRNEQACRPE